VLINERTIGFIRSSTIDVSHTTIKALIGCMSFTLVSV